MLIHTYYCFITYTRCTYISRVMCRCAYHICIIFILEPFENWQISHPFTPKVCKDIILHNPKIFIQKFNTSKYYYLICYHIKISPIAPVMLFTAIFFHSDLGSSPRSPFAFSRRISLVSFNLKQFLGLAVSAIELTLLRNVGRLLGRRPPIWIYLVFPLG